MRENLDWSDENLLAEEGELDSQKEEEEQLFQSEADRSAQAEKCRDEDKTDKVKIKAKNGWENWSRMETS